MMRFEPQSSTWLLTLEKLKQDKADCLEQLVEPNLPERDADLLRGRIQQINMLIDDYSLELCKRNN